MVEPDMRVYYHKVHNIFNKFTMFFDQHSAKDGSTESTKSVMDPLEEALHGWSQFCIRVVGDEAAAGGPHGSVGDT